MKRYTTGLLTGLLLTVSALMFMGANNQPSNENGRYQIMNFPNQAINAFVLLDTRNGDLYLSQGKTTSGKPEIVWWFKKTRPNAFPKMD